MKWDIRPHCVRVWSRCKEPLLPPRTTPQDDYGAANGADLMDGTSEDVQPPCSLAIKSPPVLASHYPYPVIYFSRGVMTSKWHNLDDHPGWLGTSNGLLALALEHRSSERETSFP